MNMPSMNMPIRVFYDGACYLCRMEVKHYEKHDSANLLMPVDISLPDFQAEEFGLDRERVQKFFHVQDESGRTVEGVDAFVEIWKRLPRYRLLARASRPWPIKFMMRIGYKFFAVIRPFLPRRKCDAGGCRR